MTNRIFSATGCARCNITKRFMKEKGLHYDEYDFKADGKEAFAKFYRAHRAEIYRDKDGVEFPVFTDGQVIRQGVSVVIGHLIAGDGLDGFIGRSTLHGEWIDGFNISGGDPSRTEELLQVMAYLKQNGLKILLNTDGHNSFVLKAAQERNLGDRIIMEVKGPAALYEALTGKTITPEELKASIGLVARFSDYRFYTTLAPMVAKDGAIRFITPEEIGETAKTIEAATGSKKHPYELKPFDPAQALDVRLKSQEPLPSSALFKYRTAARRYMVMTEIAK
jgi:pyruvate-formate lyase-activating enzyme/glutaredoxin